MDWLRQTLSRIRDLFRRGKLEREMAEEMRLHLELRAERHIAGIRRSGAVAGTRTG